MSDKKITKLILHNFKCHSEFEQELSGLTILAGGNAAGKSSVIQSILLAKEAWNRVEQKKVYTRDIEGIYMGNPSTIISEEHEDDKVVISTFVNDYENKVLLRLPSAEKDNLYFDIENYEEIYETAYGKYTTTLNHMNIFYINAERFGPRVISDICEIDQFYVGTHGENTNYLIARMDDEQKNTKTLLIPDNLKSAKINKFSANVEEWLNIIIRGTKLETTTNVELGIATIKFRNKGDNYYLPTATGFGITYILPIITQSLVASMLHNSVVLIENPEAHLHPYSQSMLGRFLALVANEGVQVIVETHSEHIVNGCRLQLGQLEKCDNGRILYFSSEDEIQEVRKIKIDKYGELEEWPKGFFDQEEKDLREILELRLCKK